LAKSDPTGAAPGTAQGEASSEQARALQHALAAESGATRWPERLAPGRAREIASVAVIGAGTMGQGIAIALLDAGTAVTLVETAADVLERARKSIAAHYQGALDKRRISQEERDARVGRLSASTSIDGVGGADCIIEAVFEDIAVKRQVFEALDRVARQGAVLATNTSYLDVAEIASFTRRPQDVIGLHFFSPAHLMRLVEVVRTDASSSDALAAGLALVKRMKKLGVVCKGKDGFVGNRMLAQRTRECLFMLEEGALPQEIDAALESFGFALGPLAVSDLAGIDIGWRSPVVRRQLRELGPRDCDLLEKMVAAKRLGQKTRAGWYRYDDGSRKPIPDPAIEAMLVEHSRERNIVRRAIAPEEIVERAMLAMINEATRIVDEGVVERAADVDAVWLSGYGFPRHRGGPLYYADQLGLAQVLARLEALAARHGATYWAPAQRLCKLAAAGQGFHNKAAKG
jgi:3-hydroxyacyl-CoA dehydrogenase